MKEFCLQINVFLKIPAKNFAFFPEDIFLLPLGVAQLLSSDEYISKCKYLYFRHLDLLS